MDPASRPARQTSALSSPLRIAIADDDRAMREILQRMLTKLGHEVVVVAKTGESLIKQCAIESPDVVVTDNMMPDISGTEVAAILYQKRPVPIILISGFCDRELVLNAERKHVLMYLVKPVSLVHLEAALACCRDPKLLRAAQGSEGEEEAEFSDGFGQPLSARPYRSRKAPYRQT